MALHVSGYRALTKVFTRFGIEVDFVDTTHTDSIVYATKDLFIETPSNPLRVTLLTLKSLLKLRKNTV